MTHRSARSVLVATRGAIASLALIVATGACSLWPDGPFPPQGGERIAERPEYLLWWKLVEDCSARRRRMDVQWYTTNGQLIQHEGKQAAGIFRPYPDRIALVNPEDGPVARHEMLHAIIEKSGHPLQQFAGMCAGIVDFSGPITYGLTEAEVRLAQPMRSDSAVAVTVRTIPESPSLSAFGGKYVFLVELTNKTDNFVMVDQLNSRIVTVQFSDSSGLHIFSQRVSPHHALYLRPQQTRRVLVDAKVGRTGPVNLSVTYGRARSALTRVVFQK